MSLNYLYLQCRSTETHSIILRKILVNLEAGRLCFGDNLTSLALPPPLYRVCYIRFSDVSPFLQRDKRVRKNKKI